ncbi:phosphate ABC transporter substrate-binding protein PstS [Actinoalloteichus hymeniacidonis]|uniref:Phosphate-binding protein n=1 Tax=Actinoalloteichus hymeniacidonis TaxID=340345 RepID=A0AAC9HV60_9PSEU|nr:phosphate ABC transporter substrate-binding protein PstS [Actinoalloteichus hymeniacidonis]AOS65949.1 phosphate ABC transporter, phosphate-binding protein [Actinoalloteichus hymeniacidonis]MBB5905955.1 phosphate transport system substrate-binding protein [Actinoalloteichus hymeniacidonis]
MKIKRHSAALGLVAASALLLSACGSDNAANPGGGPDTGTDGGSSAECGGVDQVIAEGASSQANAIDEFAAVFSAECAGQSLAYNASGSGNGRRQFIADQVMFAGSDSAMDDEERAQAEERCGGPVWHLPMVFSPVAIAYNLEGVEELVLPSEVLANIFNGTITEWNDEAIAAANEGVELPETAITVFHRSDESGTTGNFQEYLNVGTNGAWTQGEGETFGGVGEGRGQSQGVSEAVSSTDGGITYVEVSFARNADLGIAQIDAGSGPVPLTDETVGAAITGAEITGEGNDLTIDLESVFGTTEAGAYPITMATYEIVCSTYEDPEVAEGLKSFLTIAATTGQENLSEVGYTPLPAEFQERLLTAIGEIA